MYIYPLGNNYTHFLSYNDTISNYCKYSYKSGLLVYNQLTNNVYKKIIKKTHTTKNKDTETFHRDFHFLIISSWQQFFFSCLINFVLIKTYSNYILWCQIVYKCISFFSDLSFTKFITLYTYVWFFFVFSVTSVVSSILSLTLVAYDRFFGIVYAMKAHIIERSAKYSLIVIWVFSITVALPMVLFRRLYERHWKDHVELWCDDDWSIGALQGTPEPTIAFHRPARMTYYTIICLILFIFPIVAMIGAYCGIIRTLWLNQIPGERLTHDVSGQMKMKRKVYLQVCF